MRRLKARHRYHDARVVSVGYPGGGRDVEMVVELCGCCNATPGRAVVTFCGVRNVEGVRARLEGARVANAGRGRVAEVVGLVRDDVGGRGYLLDLGMDGAVLVDAEGLHEA